MVQTQTKKHITITIMLRSINRLRGTIFDRICRNRNKIFFQILIFQNSLFYLSSAATELVNRTIYFIWVSRMLLETSSQRKILLSWEKRSRSFLLIRSLIFLAAVRFIKSKLLKLSFDIISANRFSLSKMKLVRIIVKVRRLSIRFLYLLANRELLLYHRIILLTSTIQHKPQHSQIFLSHSITRLHLRFFLTTHDQRLDHIQLHRRLYLQLLLLVTLLTLVLEIVTHYNLFLNQSHKNTILMKQE